MIRPTRAITLIELLIVVAIIAVISSGLIFSMTQIRTRAIALQAGMAVGDALAMAQDALLGDLAVATERRIGDSLELSLPPTRNGQSREVTYTLGDRGLARRLVQGDQFFEATLVSEPVTGEFTEEAGGVRLRVRSAHHTMRREVVGEFDVFFAAPETVGTQP